MLPSRRILFIGGMSLLTAAAAIWFVAQRSFAAPPEGSQEEKYRSRIDKNLEQIQKATETAATMVDERHRNISTIDDSSEPTIARIRSYTDNAQLLQFDNAGLQRQVDKLKQERLIHLSHYNSLAGITASLSVPMFLAFAFARRKTPPEPEKVTQTSIA